jgi:hypothetical protein
MKSIAIGGRGAFAPTLRNWSASSKAVRILSATLLYAAALSAPGLAYAAHGGGGGGGFHGGGAGGGFHGGGGGRFHGGGGGGFHRGGFAGGIHGAEDSHSGGFHGSGFDGLHAGGFHGSGFSGGGIHPGASPGAGADRFHVGNSQEDPADNSIVLRGGERTGHWHRGWHGGRFGYWWGYDPYLWSNDDAYDDAYAYGEPNGSQSWHCSDPAGYYPSVRQCNTAWQIVPAD